MELTRITNRTSATYLAAHCPTPPGPQRRTAGRDDLDSLNHANKNCSFACKIPLRDSVTWKHLAIWGLLLLSFGQNKELGIYASVAAVDGEGVHCEMT